MNNARQLTLDLSLRPALGREDFLVAPSNAAAVALVDQWPNWPSHVAAIIGPAGSGKSHLATVWRQRSGASAVALSTLNVDELVSAFATRAIVVDVDETSAIPEVPLFHLLNMARQEGGSVLLIARQPPQQWPVALPDLVSRLNLAPVARIAEPDDALLRGLLVKQFADRQIAVSEALLEFMLRRMPRSADAARQLVSKIDAVALERGSEVNRHLVSLVLDQWTEPQFFVEDD
jgi:chromosomal replication initiation ATPase DnaA